jgi:hypothetical protein
VVVLLVALAVIAVVVLTVLAIGTKALADNETKILSWSLSRGLS